jgi:hypothetical protein
MKSASRSQIVLLQALYSHWIHNGVREARLVWASEAIGHEVASFSDLTSAEARDLIDMLKKLADGQAPEEPGDPWHAIPSRDRAEAAGTAGRRNVRSSVIQIAGPDDLARITQALERLGWTQDRYVAWLRSDRSPLRGLKEVRTVAEANKVWWALKQIMRRSGKWQPSRKEDKRPRAVSAAGRKIDQASAT